MSSCLNVNHRDYSGYATVLTSILVTLFIFIFGIIFSFSGVLVEKHKLQATVDLIALAVAEQVALGETDPCDIGFKLLSSNYSSYNYQIDKIPSFNCGLENNSSVVTLAFRKRIMKLGVITLQVHARANSIN